MKKLFFTLILLAGSYIFSQSVLGVSSSQEPQVRLHGYALYAFDDNHVDSYYSSTSFFEGSVLGGFQYGGGLEIMPYPAMGVEITYLRLD